MNRGRLEHSFFDEPRLRLAPDSLAQPTSQVAFDGVTREIGQLLRSKYLHQMCNRARVHFVGLGRSQRRLGIVLQEQLRPFFERQLFALAHDLQEVVIPRQESFPQFLVCLLPVGRSGWFLATLSRAVTVSHPPQSGSASTIQNAIVPTR